MKDGLLDPIPYLEIMNSLSTVLDLWRGLLIVDRGMVHHVKFACWKMHHSKVFLVHIG